MLGKLSGSGYKLLNWGDLMFGIAKKKYGLAHRDDIRKLQTPQQLIVQKEVAALLAKETGKIILDTHCSINTPNGYLPGLPFALLGKLKVERLVLITAPIEEIMARRKKDMAGAAGRARELDEFGTREHDSQNRAYLAAYSAFTGAPATIIYNRDNKLDEAAAKLKSLLE